MPKGSIPLPSCEGTNFHHGLEISDPTAPFAIVLWSETYTSNKWRDNGGTMARKQIVQFIDDIDGSVLDDFVTVRWALGDKQYEFDTSPEHADEFYESLQKYVAISRRADLGRQSRNGSRVVQPNRDVAEIREWARSNGYEVNARGRVPAPIIEAFEAAH